MNVFPSLLPLRCSDQVVPLVFIPTSVVLSSAPSLLLWNLLFELFILVIVFFNRKFPFGSSLDILFLSLNVPFLC